MDMDIIKDCLVHLRFSLPIELIKKERRNWWAKFYCCHNLLRQFGIDFISL